MNINYLIRSVTNEKNSLPVCIVPGNQRPELKGNSFYYTTSGGKLIRNPNSYGWPMVYHASTLRIECGEGIATKLQKEFDNPPKGIRVRLYNYLLEFTRLSDGMDYHSKASILLEKNWRGKVRKALAENYKLRIENKKRERQKRKIEEIFNREIRTTRVTLLDSVKAGNCVEGLVVVK